MTISAAYPSPIIVNGFSCRDCTDVARAEKNIDPADPMGGPFGVNSVKGSAPGKRHGRFDAAAIDNDEMAKAHAAAQRGSAVADAYGGGAASAGRFVDITA